QPRRKSNKQARRAGAYLSFSNRAGRMARPPHLRSEDDRRLMQERKATDHWFQAASPASSSSIFLKRSRSSYNKSISSLESSSGTLGPGRFSSGLVLSCRLISAMRLAYCSRSARVSIGLFAVCREKLNAHFLVLCRVKNHHFHH